MRRIVQLVEMGLTIERSASSPTFQCPAARLDDRQNMVGGGQRQTGFDAAADSAACEASVRRFEAAWQSGQVPAIDDFLPADEPSRQAAIVELVHIDLERRLKRGEPARVESYLARYPTLASDAAVVVELLAAEFEFRARTEPGLEIGEFCRRFPQFANELGRQFKGLRAHDRIECVESNCDPRRCASPISQVPAVRRWRRRDRPNRTVEDHLPRLQCVD